MGDCGLGQLLDVMPKSVAGPDQGRGRDPDLAVGRAAGTVEAGVALGPLPRPALPAVAPAVAEAEAVVTVTVVATVGVAALVQAPARVHRLVR